ncbi:hypothetical protein GCM10011515_09340 [Tsuneonella deserti]|uniref:Lipoprotein n=1 Tax=Tsuneonella deserti TaxID=2035528 RepID=A0ABQ1S6Y9_9SPHN|nr:hypothetical protein [Tsuneonella deserti]GGD91803.1 hypothetical protein GCM10011515_09340 [Tsuneonella deserti]
MNRIAALAAPVALAAASLLAGCVAVPNAPIVEGTPQPAGYAVPFDVPVHVGNLVLTPKKLVEDSRCPMNARCVWAGRVVVTTRIDGAGWRETKDLTLGESYGTHGEVFALVGVSPEKTTDREIQPAEYRFTYEPR